MRNDIEWLLDILEAIERIEKYASRGKEAFEADELIQNWIVNHLQIIGEACRAISLDMKKRHQEISWSEMVGMRDILVHRYFGIDSEVVWHVVEFDLPEMKRKVEAILQCMK
jgi:uncharacterized protein with HEPN domain